MVFYDGRRPPDDDFADVFYAASTDGGQRFTANTRVSQHTSYTGFGPRFPALDSAEGMVEFGGRLGLASIDDRVVAAWADTRNARGRSQGQAIFAAVLTDVPDVASAWATVGWVAAALGGASVVGLGVLSVLRRRRRRLTGHDEPVSPPAVTEAPS